MKKTKNKGYITQDDFTEEEKASAQKKCDEISKEYGLDKIDKGITASTDLDKMPRLSIRQETGNVLRELNIQKEELSLLVKSMNTNIEELEKRIIKHSKSDWEAFNKWQNKL